MKLEILSLGSRISRKCLLATIRKRGRERPGHTKPRVNEAVQKGLLELIAQISLKLNCAKAYTIVNALKGTYKGMKIGGTQAW